MDTRWISLVAGTVALGLGTSASAASLYRIQRVDYRDGAESLQIRMLVDDAGKRVDLSAGGKLRISFIEHGERLVLIDHLRGVYAIGDSTRNKHSPPSPSWQVTARKQFVLGEYCSVYELRWSDAVYQERCAQAMASAQQRKVGTRIGAFLQLIAATRDSTDLFLAAVEALPEAPAEAQMPVVVRHVEQGRIVCELRVLAVTSVAPSGGAFDYPRGLKRVPFSSDGLKEARL